MSISTGQVLEGKFRVESVIGEGAMGLVVEATHLDLEERVALKFLREEARARPELASRFAREAKASATIKNDHVARVYDVGTHDGAPFIVMEYLVGRDLEQILEASGPLDPTQAVEFVIQACEGLTAAHVQGIVHRDIKPGNLFVSEHGGLRQVKVLDFGISKSGLKKGTLEDVDLLTGDTTQIMGSPHYMSPEQIRSTRDVDLRADIWSLGVVLFELITGQPPFDATEVTGIIAQVLHEPHRTARSLVPDIPTGLEEVIDHCLQKDPTKRYQCAADLAVALLPFAPKRSRTVAERASQMQARATGREPAPESLPPPAYRPSPAPAPVLAPVAPVAEPASNRSFAWIALVAVVLGLGGGAFALFSRLQSPVASPEPVPTTTATPAAPAPAAEVTSAVAPIVTASAAPAPSEAPAPAVAPPPRPVVVAPAPVAPPRPRPSSPPPAPAPNAENEIRHER
ncbi:MAG: protein kinase [Labilithrix sp.]|nr:protein kinase [Labilithrix sp.]MCW5812172.1 protein kinase [Labilithrix sp.]